MTDCRCSGAQSSAKKILFYACSGGANVAEIADRAVRQLMSEGLGSVFCLAGIGAGLPNMIETAKGADLNVVLDGCPADCARKIFEHASLQNAQIVRVTDLGIEKAPKGTRATDEQVAQVVRHVKQLLAAA
jgi:uncharacterized metal-binding protein